MQNSSSVYLIIQYNKPTSWAKMDATSFDFPDPSYNARVI